MLNLEAMYVRGKPPLGLKFTSDNVKTDENSLSIVSKT